MRRAGITCLLFALACSGDKKVDPTHGRLWGRERLAQEVETRAKESIDPYLLEADEKLRRRVLAMDFEEAVARLGFVEYRGVARFELDAGTNQLVVHEDSLIQHGLHGSFRVLQKDEAGDVTREAFYDGGILFLRNGGGELRVQGVVKEQHLQLRDEAWQPLRVFTSYYGPRLGLKKIGAATAGGRSAARYGFELLPGPELVSVPGMEGSKRPSALAGELFVDEATGVPVRASLKGSLDLPDPKNPSGTTGKLRLSLNFELKTVEGVELKPKSFIPTISRHPVDLEPLAFLDGGTRTSTVIGGKAPKSTRPPPTIDLGKSLVPTSTAAEPEQKGPAKKGP